MGNIQEHHLHSRRLHDTGRKPKKKMKNPEMNKLKMFIVLMMNNKPVNNEYKSIKVSQTKPLRVVKINMVKVTKNKLLSLSTSKVKHNKHEDSKVKTNDNPEFVDNTLTKPVDKIHISYVMFMGKKSKNTKKNKKDKTKKKQKK